MDLLDDLTDVEENLQACSSNGRVLDLSDQTGDHRRVRSEVLYKLCVNDVGTHAKGVRLIGAEIEGALDFQSSSLRVPLALERCQIGDPVDTVGDAVVLNQASCSSITLDGCRIHGGVSAEELHARHTLSLQDSVIAGPVRLAGADITGDLDLVGADLSGALLLADINISGNLLLVGAELSGVDADGNSLMAERMTVGGSAFLRGGFTSAGVVRLGGADIAGNLELVGADLSSPIPSSA